MTHEDLLARITIDSAACHGTPCSPGLRVGVGLVVGMLEAGMTEAEILESSPSLEPADIRACLAFAGPSATRASSFFACRFA